MEDHKWLNAGKPETNMKNRFKTGQTSNNPCRLVLSCTIIFISCSVFKSNVSISARSIQTTLEEMNLSEPKLPNIFDCHFPPILDYIVEIN